jgi:hypothetical protein
LGSDPEDNFTIAWGWKALPGERADLLDGHAMFRMIVDHSQGMIVPGRLRLKFNVAADWW